MKRFSKKTISLYVLCSLFLIILVSFVSAEVESHTGVVRGKVLPTDSNATVYASYLGLETPFSARINSEGEYSLELPMAVYTLLIVGEGNYINRSLLDIGVREGTIIELEDVTLAKIGETGSVSGHVDPVVEGIVVWIKRTSEPDSFSFIDDEGYYQIDNLVPGTYGLYVYFNETQNFVDYDGFIVGVVANEHLSGIDLRFTPKPSDFPSDFCLIDRVEIKFNEGVSKEEKKRVIESYGGIIMSDWMEYSTGTYVVLIPKERTVGEMVDLFASVPAVKRSRLSCYAQLATEKIYTVEKTVYIPAQIRVPIAGKEVETKEEPEGVAVENTSLSEDIQDVEKLVVKPTKSEPVKKEQRFFISKLIWFFKSLFGIK